MKQRHKRSAAIEAELYASTPAEGDTSSTGDGTLEGLRASLEELTVAELKAEAGHRGLEVPSKATKAEIVDLIVDAAE